MPTIVGAHSNISGSPSAMSKPEPIQKPRARKLKQMDSKILSDQARALQTLFAARAYANVASSGHMHERERHAMVLQSFMFYVNGSPVPNSQKTTGGFWSDDADQDKYWSIARSKLSEASRITKEVLRIHQFFSSF